MSFPVVPRPIGHVRGTGKVILLAVAAAGPWSGLFYGLPVLASLAFSTGRRLGARTPGAQARRYFGGTFGTGSSGSRSAPNASLGTAGWCGSTAASRR